MRNNQLLYTQSSFLIRFAPLVRGTRQVLTGSHLAIVHVGHQQHVKFRRISLSREQNSDTLK